MGIDHSVNKTENLLSGINLAAIDSSAAQPPGFRTIELFSAAIGLTAVATTVTGASINVKESSSQTIFLDVTGATTGIQLTLRGGINGFGMITLRSFTGSGGEAIYAWKNMAIGNATGITAGHTGITRVDDMQLEVNYTANTGAGTGVAVTVRARALLSPDF